LGLVASSAFRTLSRLCSNRCLPALFHAGPALGVLPSGLISLAGHWLFRASCPLVVGLPVFVGAPAFRFAAGFLGDHPAKHLVKPLRNTTQPGLPHFRAFISARVCVSSRRIRSRKRPQPSWAFPSEGTLLLSPASLPRNPSSPELHCRLISRQLPFRVYPAKESALLRGVAPPLPRFATFSADPESSRYSCFWVAPLEPLSVTTFLRPIYEASAPLPELPRTTVSVTAPLGATFPIGRLYVTTFAKASILHSVTPWAPDVYGKSAPFRA
jgi:hypothetical protein